MHFESFFQDGKKLRKFAYLSLSLFSQSLFKTSPNCVFPTVDHWKKEDMIYYQSMIKHHKLTIAHQYVK